VNNSDHQMKQVGDYLLQESIGRGAYAEVNKGSIRFHKSFKSLYFLLFLRFSEQVRRERILFML